METTLIIGQSDFNAFFICSIDDDTCSGYIRRERCIVNPSSGSFLNISCASFRLFTMHSTRLCFAIRFAISSYVEISLSAWISTRLNLSYSFSSAGMISCQSFSSIPLNLESPQLTCCPHSMG